MSKRDKETIHFLQWIKLHSGWWHLICTPGDEHMTLSMMKSLVQRLAKEGLYEIIFVLLMVHRNAVFMDNVFKNLLLEMILAGWRGETYGKNRIVQDMADLST